MNGPEWTDDHGCGAYATLINEEHAAQTRKWDVQTHTVAEWALILAEEEGELAREMLGLQFGGSHFTGYANLRHEAVQVATVALRIAEMARQAEIRMGGPLEVPA